ncbi:hypothetical protein SNE40_000386 [Patella caerulea]|uniref:Uncharacterized protein n=1 Tax=Patella caerulea TaxID=87958 RepID=A0AAN8Q1G9_PATCE
MDFFVNDEEEDVQVIPDLNKLEFAPLTNLGCESQFAKLDNRVRYSGGMTCIATHSKKNIVATNGLLVSDQFLAMDDVEKKRKWKWARSSEEVQRVQQLEANFLAIVKETKKIALKKKEDLKQKKNTKVLQLLDSCKRHGGPITSSCLPLLRKLDERQLLLEVGYIRSTLDPSIRQKRRVTAENGKFKFVAFTINELRQSIKAAICPQYIGGNDIETLLKCALAI